ncbi:MAG: glycosyltransferase family 2 protein [Lutibacter sp.]
MKNNNCLVSIIVPCYNQAQYLDEALQSVLDQTYTIWECIIVNDGSPDNTEEIAKKWVEKDSRFKYLFKENGGLSSTRNYGITHAIGEFILPLDADDKIATKYIELALYEFSINTNLKLVYCKAEKFGKETGEWKLNKFSLKNLASENMIFCSAFFKRKDWETIGGYDVKMVYGWEDWEFWIRLLKNGGQVKCLNSTNFFYRTNDNSMTSQLKEENFKYLKDYLSIKHADFFIGQYGSFFDLKDEIFNHSNNVQILNKKMQSKSFLIKKFFYLIFGFKIFKND